MKNWVKQLTRLRGYTDQMVEDANAVILTFGSYRLGVSILPALLTSWFIAGEANNTINDLFTPFENS